jgi:hypothetical protein
MSRLKVGVIRYASVANAIERALGIEKGVDCRIGHGRITVTLRQLGASRWPEPHQVGYALRVAGIARGIIAGLSRRGVRRRGAKAIVVVYEDTSLAEGCAVTSKWECVVPAPESHDE